ncbi:hypothetical protein LSTR_LSTR010279 [Laodelphax striatellus]|uniref:Uncharacterized protein n=1 Tax=Laodelphax striatellus TaxID=195883 RepID=A0A482XR83_LAOST|nr:hypothetical protein LSTR_LSTR010279 [Laodelphax striatellus]
MTTVGLLTGKNCSIVLKENTLLSKSLQSLRHSYVGGEFLLRQVGRTVDCGVMVGGEASRPSRFPFSSCRSLESAPRDNWISMVILQVESGDLVLDRPANGYQLFGATCRTLMEFHLDSAEYCQAQHK